MLVLALLSIVAACGPPPEATPSGSVGSVPSSSAAISPVPESGAPSAVPSATLAAPGGPSASGAPTPSPDADAAWPAPTLDLSLAWHRVGTIKAVRLEAVVGFKGGYIAVSRFQGAFRSPDGVHWRSIRLPRPVGQTIDVAATSSRLIIVGAVDDRGCDTGSDTGGSCPATPVSWWSNDALVWHASKSTNGVDAVHYDEFTSVWAAPAGGWDAALATRSGAAMVGAGIWHTNSGASWRRLDPAPPDTDGESAHGGAAAFEGDRLVWRGIADPESNEWVTTVSISSTGRGWQPTSFPGERATVMAAASADPDARHPWVLVGSKDEGSPVAWVASDGADWRSIALPTNRGFTGRVDDIVATSSGDVAVGQQFDGESGNHETWISRDSRRWSVLPRIGTAGRDYGPGLVAWGPAGVLGFGVMPDANDMPTVVVWKLR